MKKKPLLERINRIRAFLEPMGPGILSRKMCGIVDALEVQVEDGQYARHAVVRLGEALLATAEFNGMSTEKFDRLEKMVCDLIDVVERAGR